MTHDAGDVLARLVAVAGRHEAPRSRGDSCAPHDWRRRRRDEMTTRRLARGRLDRNWAWRLMGVAGWIGLVVPACGNPTSEDLSSMQRAIRREFSTVRHVSAADLAAWLADGSGHPPQLLDVRAEEEFAVSHLAGAIRVSPGASVEDILARIDPERPIVAYCSVGYRSSRLVQRLQDAGVRAAANLEGSIFAWANEGRPLVRGDEAATLVHPYDRSFASMLAPERRAPLGE